MRAAAPTRAAIAAVLAAPLPARALDDERLLAEAEAWEAIGRVVDARRVAVAAEVDWRSRPQVGADGLAARMGAADGTKLLTDLLRIGTHEARRRGALGRELAPRVSLTGEELPGRFPTLASAVRAGEVGLDAARLITTMLGRVRRRTTPEERSAAEEALTETATTTAPDLLQVHVETWEVAVDPDGVEPREQEIRAARAIRIGRTKADGTTTLTAQMTPEETALARAALDAHRRGPRWVLGEVDHADAGRPDSADPDGHDTGDADPCWHEADGDQRTRPQYDYDVLFGILRAGLRAEQDGTGDTGTTPHEVVVHVRAEDLADGHGAGWADDVLAPFSLPTVTRLTCSGTTRLLVAGPDGEALYLGHRVRLFTKAQKRAVAARDGGCAWPGCTAPTAWTEVHHIRWHARDRGRTDVDNGVLLCSHHHHLVHTTEQWRIETHHRRPHLVPTTWQGPPLPRHRMQQHPLAARTARPPRRT